MSVGASQGKCFYIWNECSIMELDIAEEVMDVLVNQKHEIPNRKTKNAERYLIVTITLVETSYKKH
ncbi:hypothetical protein ABB05_16585 [Lederbergia galactosidilytica]|uniref:Uncharacterized protein n=1 Tax=Lederbergia galactosidilytica TaxID=217031 RepID=A0A177ZJN5_9BACI|nr:hypothetical protein ABB05_16585 [Lederbergia galactosidilytica]